MYLRASITAQPLPVKFALEVASPSDTLPSLIGNLTCEASSRSGKTPTMSSADHENFAPSFSSIVNVVLVWLSAISKSWARIVTLSILTGASSASDVSSLVQDVDINADMAAMILSVILFFMIIGVLN